MDPDDGIIFECAPFIRVYWSGRVERCPEATATTPPGLDPATGVSSKDVPISPETGVRARLYLPAAAPAGKLPVLVYYHGGSFCLDSAFSPTYHNYLNSLAARADALVVSVDYRLAPEHPIPAAFDDAWLALRWVAAHAGGPAREPWLVGRGDFGRLFVAGDSAGANLAHSVAMRAGDVGGAPDLRGVRIAGVVLVHPYFLGAAPVESEAMNPALAQTLVNMWRMVCGSTTADVDDPRINPLAAGAPGMGRLACMRVLVCSAEQEILKDRAKAYCRTLREEGGGDHVEFYEAIGEGHIFHIADPKCEGAVAQDRVICSFINHGTLHYVLSQMELSEQHVLSDLI